MKITVSSLCAILALFSSFPIKAQSNDVCLIEIKMEKGFAPDSFTLDLFEKTLCSRNFDNWASASRRFISYKVNDHYSFELKLKEPAYVILGKDFEAGNQLIPLLNMFLVEPGDQVTIVINGQKNRDTPWRKNDAYWDYIYNNGDYSVSFLGKGSAKYQCKYEMDKVTSMIRMDGGVIDNKGKLLKGRLFIDKCFDTSFYILNSYKKKLSTIAYQTLDADLIGKHRADWYTHFIWDFQSLKDTESFDPARAALKKRMEEDGVAKLSDMAKAYSAYYSVYAIQQAVAIANVNLNKYGNTAYEYLKKHYKGELQQKILVAYLAEWVIFLNDAGQLLDDAIANTSTFYYDSTLLSFRDRFSKGKPAYKFSLPDVNNNVVRLEDFKKKVVFIDFWYTGCDKCATYFEKVLSEVEEDYKDNSNIQFITISIDPYRDKWIQSVNKGIYTSGTAINLYTEGKGANHDIIKYYMVHGFPRPMLIDKRGQIFSATATDLRNKEKLRKLIEEALKQE